MQPSRLMSRVNAPAGLLVVNLVVAACGALDTQNPNIVDAGNLNTPAGAETKRLGAISQFT
jgi:hypothetical protein